ncbi:MAG TPA: Gldg family protein [Planctomycetota bacterium]|nr:Gldg family protein [Planctomycetota bacterium]
MIDQNRGRYWTAWALGLGIAGICAALNWAVARVETRADLTEDKRYTLPEAVKRIAERLDPALAPKVTVYLSENLPQRVEHLARALQIRLSELRRASNGALEYEFVDPKEDVDLIQRLKKDHQIEPIQIPDLKGGTQTIGNYFLNLVVSYGDQKEAMSLLELQQDILKEETTLSGLSGFLAARLTKVMSGDVAVGIVSKKEKPPAQPGQSADHTDGLRSFRDLLGKHVKIQDVVLTGGVPVPENISALVVFKPDGLADVELFQLDQYLMRGGKVIVLYDAWSTYDPERESAVAQAIQQSNTYALREVKSGMREFLAHYGFRMEPGVLHDRANLSATFRVVTPDRRLMLQQGAMPGVVHVRATDDDKNPTGQVSEDDFAVSGMTAMAFVLPTPMRLEPAEEFAARHTGARLVPLLRTSPEAWVVTDVSPSAALFNAPPAPREQWSQFDLAGRASGPLKSYFAGREPPLREGQPEEMRPKADQMLKSAAPDAGAQLWVVADSDFALDAWQAIGRNFLGSVQLMQTLQRSQALLMNMVDAAAFGADLVEIRKPRLNDRSVDEERVKADRDGIIIRNLFLMPLVLIGLGLLRWWWRSAATFVASPRQPVDVGGPPPPPPPVAAASQADTGAVAAAPHGAHDHGGAS